MLVGRKTYQQRMIPKLYVNVGKRVGVTLRSDPKFVPKLTPISIVGKNNQKTSQKR